MHMTFTMLCPLINSISRRHGVGVYSLYFFYYIDVIDVRLLDQIEQGLHFMIKVLHSNLSWFLSSIYASPHLRDSYFSIGES